MTQSDVGPVETWTPSRAPGPAQDPGGRSDSPDPLRPPGAISVPCGRCEGGSEPPVDEPCPPCEGRGSVDLRWRVSPHDGEAHAFIVPPVDGGPSSAPRPCYHSAPTDQLTDNVDDVTRCVLCLIVVGGAVATRVERAAAAMLKQQEAHLRQDERPRE